MKVRISKLSEKEVMKTLDTLYTTVSAIKSRDAVKLFLKDLLTPSERIMLGRRIIIARKILNGTSHREIVGSLGVGLDTIARVQKWLEDQLPGYEQAIAGLEKEFNKRREKRLYSTNALYHRLKNKYPLSSLLFPTPISKGED